ncbi:MAG: hypothetical protein ACI9MF_002492, partial [Gammaproteobacteria bacterium]
MANLLITIFLFSTFIFNVTYAQGPTNTDLINDEQETA